LTTPPGAVYVPDPSAPEIQEAWPLSAVAECPFEAPRRPRRRCPRRGRVANRSSSSPVRGPIPRRQLHRSMSTTADVTGTWSLIWSHRLAALGLFGGRPRWLSPERASAPAVGPHARHSAAPAVGAALVEPRGLEPLTPHTALVRPAGSWRLGPIWTAQENLSNHTAGSHAQKVPRRVRGPRSYLMRPVTGVRRSNDVQRIKKARFPECPGL